LLISIFAGLVFAGGFVWRLFIGMPDGLFNMAWWVSLGIVIFYIIGQFARSILVEQVFLPIENEYDFSQDEEYKTFMANLDEEYATPENVMFDEPNHTEFDDSFDDGHLEPMPLQDAS
jgi:hypothetical protein